jgi:hypothetical protein
MKVEKPGAKAPKKRIEEPDTKSNRKRLNYLVTYAVEGARSKRQKASAYSEDEATEIVTKKLNGQIANGEINGFKIISVEIDNQK